MHSIPASRRAPRRARATAASLALLAALGLSACADSSVQLDVLGPSVDPVKEPALNVGPAIRRTISRVDRIEIGSLHDGVAVSAFGEAPASRWFGPRLDPRRGGAPGPDGFLEFDFVAAPPELNGAEAPPVGNAAQRRIRADRILSRADIGAAVGVRVFAEAGPVATRF